jgi:hypothetical protein
MQDLVASYTSLRGRVIELSPFLGKVKKAGSLPKPDVMIRTRRVRQ